LTREISLSVNGTAIKLDHFVAGYLEQLTRGILASLKDTGEIKKLKLTIDKQGKVEINLNGTDLPINYFVEEILRSTYKGAVMPLKGVDRDKPLQTLELNIIR
jgi:hypothetical protein